MRKQKNLPGFGAYMLRLSTELEGEGRLGTSRTYAKTRSSFLTYLGGGDIPISGVDARLMEDYNRHLRGHGLTRNTISFYNRVLRAAYNKAVLEFGLCDCRPFRNVYTGVDRTSSRAVDETFVARLLSLDLEEDKGLILARDLFIFSYSMRGMSFVDMAYLRKSQIRDGYLTYSRRKTGVTLRIRIENEALDIINKYSSSGKNGFIFPILGENQGTAEAYLRYCSALSTYNRRLKRLAGLAGIGERLTSHVARHSWATAARNAGSGVTVISEALGHSSERMTRIYLGSLDSSLVDAVNRKLMERLLTKAGRVKKKDRSRVFPVI